MHPVLGFETGWRMKPLGEVIGPVEEYRGPFSAWECGAETVGLLAVHNLMSEAEVSSMVIGHTSCRVLLFTVLMEVNEGITLFSLALRKCNSTISTMLPMVTSNAEQIGDVARIGIEGFRGNWNDMRRLRSAAMTREKDE